MIDAFRSEFRFAPTFIAELLRRFDGDFLNNMRRDGSFRIHIARYIVLI